MRFFLILKYVSIFGIVTFLSFSKVAASVPPAQTNIIRKLPPTPDMTDASNLIKSLVNIPENEIDLLWSALVIDKYINPQIDIQKTYRQIESMGEIIDKMAGSNATELQKLSAVRRYIYKAGDWNNNKSFSYDFNNPQGCLSVHKTLDYYIENRLGNCVSMPIFYLVLAEQVGVDVSLIAAPTHLQIRYTDSKTGKYVNLETTSGANPSRAEWLKTQLPWNDRAIDTGLYLKTLTKREMIAEMGTTILQRLYNEDKNYRENIEVANILLETHQTFDIPLLHINGSAEHIVLEEYISKYKDPNMMLPQEKREALNFMKMGDMALEQLVRLGYKFPPRKYDPLTSLNVGTMQNVKNNDLPFFPTFQPPTIKAPTIQNSLPINPNVAPIPNLLNPFPLLPNTAPSPYIGQRR